jgi:hypothetical protein
MRAHAIALIGVREVPLQRAQQATQHSCSVLLTVLLIACARWDERRVCNIVSSTSSTAQVAEAALRAHDSLGSLLTGADRM